MAEMRADAARNLERVLDAARDLLGDPGRDSSMKAIAAAAGVGVATLYRRFPTREALIEAVYRAETERLGARAPQLLEELEPAAALRAWADEFVEYMLLKDGMADALPAILSQRDGLRTHSRAVLLDAITLLVEAARTAGQVRPDLDPFDVNMAFGGVTLIAQHESDRELAGRLLDLTFSGILRAPH